MSKRIPYPLRATKFSLDFNPFHFWWKPSFTHRKTLSEAAKADGATIWVGALGMVPNQLFAVGLTKIR